MAIYGIAIAFIVITVLVQRKVPLGLSLMTGAAIVGLTSGEGPLTLLRVAFEALVEPTAVDLMLTLALLSVLGYIMQERGLLARMVELLQVVMRSTKLTIMLVPSIIGTLLVTGGAIMSAPTVRQLGEELELPPERMSAINLLFRHGWYFVYPLMPAFVLVTSITGVKLSTLLLAQLPLCIATLVAGYFSYLHGVKDKGRDKPKPSAKDILELVKCTTPIWLSLLLTVAFGLAFPLALVAGLATALIIAKVPLNEAPRLLLRGVSIPIVLSGAGIMIFKAVTGRVEALPILIDQLLQTGLPVRSLFIILPFFAGMVSASNTSALGLTLPLLLPTMHSTDLVLFGTVAAYTASFVGYYVSPLHLCQVLTLEHFKCNIMPLYRQYLWPMAAISVTLVALGFVL